MSLDIRWMRFALKRGHSGSWNCPIELEGMPPYLRGRAGG